MFRPHFLLWVIGWRPVLRRELVFEFAQCDFRWSIAKLRLHVSSVARPSLPQLSGKESQYQLAIMCCIRACTLYNGFLAPGEGLVLATVSRFGFAVWWKLDKWACSHQNQV